MSSLRALADTLRASPGLRAKASIALATDRLGLRGTAVPVGDDCAAIPDAGGFSLFAIEGFINAFVAADPWFAGWCGVMVNLSDIAAMGGRPTALVNALWSDGAPQATPILNGMRAAADRFGVPMVGGHLNLGTDRGQLAVAVLGRAQRLLTSFDARPGDRLVMAADLRGAWRPPFLNWQAALDAPAERLRADLALLPHIAEAGLSRAAKDISQAGLVGTAIMLAECSGAGIRIDLAAIPRPPGVALEQWLLAFPSYGYLIAAPTPQAKQIIALFQARDIAAADIGAITQGSTVTLADGAASEIIRDWAAEPLLGLAP